MKRQATLDDLAEIPEGFRGEIVNGEVVMIPAGDEIHQRTSMWIAHSLLDYERRTQLGYALIDTHHPVTLPNRLSFCPDAAFRKGAPISDDPDKRSLDAPIVFVVEVRSDTDYGPRAERAMAAKRAEYVAAGVLVVWDVDVRRAMCVRSYRADAAISPLVFSHADEAHAEPALPGWRMSVDEILNARRPW